jgi:hypothetical protein
LINRPFLREHLGHPEPEVTLDGVGLNISPQMRHSAGVLDLFDCGSSSQRKFTLLARSCQMLKSSFCLLTFPLQRGCPLATFLGLTGQISLQTKHLASLDVSLLFSGVLLTHSAFPSASLDIHSASETLDEALAHFEQLFLPRVMFAG